MLIAISLIVVGCYDSTDVIVHEPGIYKGARDPLLAKQQSAHQQERLRDRVMLIQADR